MKRILTFCFLFFCFFGAKAQLDETETFGAPTATTAIASFTGYSLSNLTYAGTADIRNSTPSPSGGGNVFFTASGRNIIISGFSPSSSCTGFTLNFLILKTTNAENGSGMLVEYSTTGAAGPWVSAGSFTLPTGSGTTNVYNNRNVTIPEGTNLKAVRFQSSSTSQFRIDDVNFVSSTAGCTALPVTLTSLIAKSEGATNLLTWATAQEKNNSHFEVLRSNDGKAFAKIGTVQGSGTTAVGKTYTFADNAPVSGVNYYRLRQVDFDGKSELTKVVTVANGTSALSIVRASAVNGVEAEFTVSKTKPVQASLRDMSGRVVVQKMVETTDGVNVLSFNELTLSNGIYILTLTDGVSTATQKIVKQ